jgi:hypothetical protein
MTETELLNEISVKRFIGFTKDDITETFASRNKLAAYDLIEETKPNHWILTKDGYKAIEIGFEQWMKINGNSEMTLYDKIPLQLELGHFIDIIPLFPDESYDNLRKTCLLLKKDGLIDLKGRTLAISLGDNIYASDLTPQIECRLLRDNKTKHTTVIDKSINLKDSMYVGGDNSGNMGQSSGSSLNIITPTKKETTPATIENSVIKLIIKWWWLIVAPALLVLLGVYADKHHWFE